MAERSLVLRIRADLAQARAAVQGFSNDLQKVGETANKRAAAGLQGMAKSARDNRAEWEQLGRGLTTFGAVGVAAFGASAKAAIDWESAFAGVKKTVDDNAEGYASLSRELRDMALVLPASHSEIAGVAEAAGQLGIQRGNITSFTRSMIDLGEATNLSAEEAATALARFANIMGTSQDKFSNIGSAVVDLGNNFATTEREIVEMGLRLAGAGKQAGLTEGEVLGLATALSSVGIEAEAGGTAFSKVIIEMGKSVDSGNEKLETFATVAGMSTAQFAQAWEDNAGAALAAFIGGLGDIEASGESIQPILEELGMTDVRVGDALRRSSTAADLFTDAMGRGNQAYEDNIALTKEAEQRYATVESQLAMARNAISDAAISFGEVLLPAVAGAAGVIADFAEWLADLPRPVQTAVTILGGLGSSAALAAGGFMLLAPRAIETWDALSRMGRAGEMAQTGLTKVGKGLARIAAYAGVAVLLGEIGDGLRNIIYSSDDADRLVNMFTTMGDSADFATQKLHSFALFWESDGITGAEVLDRFSGAMDDAFGDSALQKANRFGDTVMGWMPGATTATERLTESMAEIDQAVAQLASSGNTEAAASAFSVFWEEASAQGYNIEQVLEAFPEYESYLVNLATELGITANEQNLLNLALGGMPQPMLDITGRAGELKDALIEAYKAEQDLTTETSLLQEAAEEAAASWDELVESLLSTVDASFDAERAAIAWEQALADLNATVKENGKNTDLSTEAGRANRQALLDVAQQARDTAAANLANGDSLFQVKKDMDSARDAFIKGAQQMGYTKAEANELADQLGLTDEGVNTLSASIERVPSKHVDVTVGGVEDATRNVQVLKGAIDSVTGKTVNVHVVTNWSERGRRPVHMPGGRPFAAEQGAWIETRAAGGFDQAGAYVPRQSMMGGPQFGKTNILWGEPTTGWEAYISGASSRERSLAILSQAADKLGASVVRQYASGGLTSVSAVRDAYTVSVGAAAPTPAAALAGSMQGLNAAWQAGPTFNITNIYPQAEPTSKTVQRASQHQAAAGRY